MILFYGKQPWMQQLAPWILFGMTASRENTSPKLLQGERQKGQIPYEEPET
jgi:hypothetical protein